MRAAFEHKTVVVTGGGSGIGRAMVAQFVAEGASVVAADVNAASLVEVKARWPTVVTVVADISNPEDVDRIFALTPDGIDVVCNNAGVSDGTTLLDEVTEEEWDRCLAVNLTGTFLMCRRALPLLKKRGGGAIINTASVAGLRGSRGGLSYTAAKWGVVGLTHNIAATFAKDGIRCNAICPGPVDTNIMTLAPRSARGVHGIVSDPAFPEQADPAEVAAVAVMLARDELNRVNGVAVPVDSGWLAH